MKTRILVDDAVLGAEEILGKGGGGTVTLAKTADLKASLDRESFDGLVVRSTLPVDADLIGSHALRFVATATVGVDHVDLSFLRERGLAFAHAAGSSARTVAEFSWALIHLAMHRLGRSTAKPRTLAVIGRGAIGSRVALLGEAAGWRVLCNDPPLEEHNAGGLVPLAVALLEADVISLHVPLMEDGPCPTRGLVDDAFLSQVRRDAVLINTSRGAVVNEADLLAALKDGRLGGAALDVFLHEPAPCEDLLKACVVTTPHVAGRSVDGLQANTRAIGEKLAGAGFLNRSQTHRHATPPAISFPSPITGTSVASLIEAAWELESWEALLRNGADGFSKARALAARRRDLRRHTFECRLSPDQQTFLDGVGKL